MTPSNQQNSAFVRLLANIRRGQCCATILAVSVAAVGCGGSECNANSPLLTEPLAPDQSAQSAEQEPSEGPTAPLDSEHRSGGRLRETSDAPGKKTQGPPPLCASPGEIGCQCAAGDECNSGRCEWGFCTGGCTPYAVHNCAGDWRCLAPGGGPALCAPPFVSFCWPCEVSSDCARTNAGDAKCIRLGQSGSYCSANCAVDDDCPMGFVCSELEGESKLVCVPDDFACDCGGYDIPADWERTTTCEVTNGWGTCEGERWCEAGELMACTAPEPRQEKCNGLDDDCDGQIDRPMAVGCTPYFSDHDGDGAGDSDDTQCLCAPEVPYTAAVGGDCDETNPAVNPNAPEVCNGRDDNCNGVVDEEDADGCTMYYADKDGDGFGTLNLGVTQPGGLPNVRCLCAPQGIWTATQVGDCEDDDAKVHPSAEEVCNGIDDNCDGATDEEGALGCFPHFKDADGDGFGSSENLCLCNPQGQYIAFKTGDCNDGNSAIYPGAEEVCDDIDNNCNGSVDENCDADGGGL